MCILERLLGRFMSPVAARRLMVILVIQTLLTVVVLAAVWIMDIVGPQHPLLSSKVRDILFMEFGVLLVVMYSLINKPGKPDAKR